MPRFRPRLRFSLRTLFVLVTPICIWFAYYHNWAQQRCSFTAAGGVFDWGQHAREADEISGPFPLGLNLLGERPILKLWINTDDPVEIERVKRLFPEASIRPIVSIEPRPPSLDPA